MVPFTEIGIEAEEVGNIVEQLEDSLEDIPTGHAIVAMLSLVVLKQKSDISQDELQEVVYKASSYICELLDEVELLSPNVAAKDMN